MKKTILSLFIGSLLFSACHKESFIEQATKTNCIPQSEVPVSKSYICDSLVAVTYSGRHCGFIPLSYKNYWVYEDSFFNNGVFVNVQYDTLRYKKTFRSIADNLIWWESNLDIGLPTLLYANQDGIYQLGRRYFNGCTWDTNKEFIVPSGDSSRYLARFEDLAAQGRSVKLAGMIKTPTGSFENCILFEKNARNYRKDQVIIKPGIGVVKYISERSQMGHPILKLHQISTLVNFYLE